jgi:nucleoid DNA-binding protein
VVLGSPIALRTRKRLCPLQQRIGRNPKTGTEVPISPRRVMVFKPSAILKQRINGHHHQAEAND